MVLTTSEAEEDVLRSYALHANAYVTKPVDFERFIEVVRQIDDFFVTVVRLPGQGEWGRHAGRDRDFSLRHRGCTLIEPKTAGRRFVPGSGRRSRPQRDGPRR